jgi:hypothetical protein
MELGIIDFFTRHPVHAFVVPAAELDTSSDCGRLEIRRSPDSLIIRRYISSN